MQTIKQLKNKIPLIITLMLIAWSAFWLTWNAATMSMTSDETVYIPSGVRMITKGDIVLNIEHPPINKIISGFFVLPISPDINKAIEAVPENDQWYFGNYYLFQSGNNANLILFLGRLPTILLTLLLLFLVWLWTSKNIHPWAGTGAIASLALNPNIIAHGALSTNDLHLAFAVWLLFLATNRVIKDQKLPNFIWLGLAYGLIMMVKFNGIFFVILSVIVIAIFFIVKKLLIKKNILGIMLSAIICIFFIWIGYLFIERTTLFGSQIITITVPTVGVIQTDNVFIKVFLAPFIRYWEGYIIVKSHNDGGHISYLNGIVSYSGFRTYFLYGLWYKTPTAILFLGLIGLIWAFIKKQWVVVLLCGIGVVFVAAASFGRIHIGIRHILPFYILLAPAVGFCIWQIIESRKKLVYLIFMLIVFCWLVDIGLNSPNKISYFSQISGGWKNGYQHLIDSNTDWGQENRLLKNWQTDHPDKKMIIGYACGENPKYTGLEFTDFINSKRDFSRDGLREDEVLITSVNIVVSQRLIGLTYLFDAISNAEHLGQTYLIYYPEDLK